MLKYEFGALLFAVVWCACASTSDKPLTAKNDPNANNTAPLEQPAEHKDPDHQTASRKDPGYPYSEVKKVYDTVLDAMTEKYLAHLPDSAGQHTTSLRTYILEEYPKEKFVQEIVKEEYVKIFDRASKDEAFQDTPEFENAFTIVINVSVPLAMMIIGGLIDVYHARFIEKDPIKIFLFEIAEKDQFQFVSWVSQEAGIEEVREELGGDRDLREGDRFFRFSSPPWTWENMTGRAGYLQVRDDKIIDAIVTTMN